VRIASRGSQLALWQAHAVRDALRRAQPGLEVEIEVIRTTGDRILDVPLARIGDRGLFTKEIDAALLQGRADLAVHSLKDVPTRVPDGLQLAAVTEREDPRDVLIVREGVPGSLAELPAGARIGTSSLRRRAQLRAVRPDLEVLDLRGNLNTRLAKLDAGGYEGIILAAAGVLRLGWEERIAERLDIASWLPAVGQGAMAIVARAETEERLGAMHALHHAPTAAAVQGERAFLRALEGGCQIPIAAIGRVEGESLVLDGLVAELDGETILRHLHQGPVDAAERVGTELAGVLLDRGAGPILEEIRRRSAAPPIPAP
jgi:hydroxymethylbilane synthase